MVIEPYSELTSSLLPLPLPASFKNMASVFFAHARASSVLPVPGGPYRSTPLGAYTDRRVRQTERRWVSGGGMGVNTAEGLIELCVEGERWKG
jgi:hypothetical protein